MPRGQDNVRNTFFISLSYVSISVSEENAFELFLAVQVNHFMAW